MDTTTSAFPRFGVIVPWMNTRVEDDLISELHNECGLHFARITPASFPSCASDESYLKSMYENVASAKRSFTNIRTTSIITACASLAVGLQEDCLIISAFECMRRSMADRIPTAKSIGLLAPYSDHLIRRMAEQFRVSEIPVTSVEQIRVVDEFKDVDEAALAEQATNMLKNCDAVMISCTALPTLNITRASSSEIMSTNSSIIEYIRSKIAAKREAN